jgi:large subunit ribosomal protein L25
MISDITVQAQARTCVGSADARRLRNKGLIPATIYGDNKPPISVAVEGKQITRILRSETGHNTIFNLQTPDQDPTTVMIKDWQIDPVKGKVMHADFVRISLTEKRRVSVPVEVKGEAAGVRLDGGILDHVLREIEVECLPADIPEHITIDVSALRLGGHISARDVKVADNVRVVTSPEQVIVAVVAPASEEDAAASAVSEPELIRKGKEDKA